jgi:hypothetical protein
MRSGTLLLAAIAAAVLVGCGSQRIRPTDYTYIPNPFVKSAQCGTPACSLVVTVNDCANGIITVTDPETNSGPDLDMSTGSGARSVTWKIVTPGYEFPKEPFKYGILIKGDPDDEFKNAHISGGGDSLTLDYNKKGTGTRYYVYGLQLRSTIGNKPFCALLDPWVIT